MEAKFAFTPNEVVKKWLEAKKTYFDLCTFFDDLPEVQRKIVTEYLSKIESFINGELIDEIDTQMAGTY